MALVQSVKPHSVFAYRRNKGVTLIEVALTIMIMVILSIGVSSLIRTGVESQLSQRSHVNMQIVAMNIADDLRRDLRTADSAEVQNGGNRLVIRYTDVANSSQTITYSLDTVSGDFTRVGTGGGSGASKTYNPNTFTPRLQVACLNGASNAPCFAGLRKNSTGAMIADNTTPQQVTISDITVRQVVSGSGTMIDQAFSAPQYAIRNMSLSLISQTEFQ